MQRLFLGLIVTSIVAVSATDALASKHYRSSLVGSDNSVLVAEASASQFVSVEHPTSGQVSIIEEDGTRYLAIGEDFQSDRGPALQVILHKSDTVGLQIEEGDYVSLGELQSFNGAQRYVIPEAIDLTQYQSVAVWCEEFNATFGYAPLAK